MTASLLKSLLSILAYLSNAIVRMVLISKSPGPCTNPLVTVSSASITSGIIVTFMFHTFSVPSESLGTFFFRFPPVLPCDQPEKQILLFGRFSFLCWLSLGLVVWPRFDDLFVSQNLKEFCVSFSRTVEHFPFVRLVKFQFLAQFPVDYLSHSVTSCLVLS